MVHSYVVKMEYHCEELHTTSSMQYHLVNVACVSSLTITVSLHMPPPNLVRNVSFSEQGNPPYKMQRFISDLVIPGYVLVSGVLISLLLVLN